MAHIDTLNTAYAYYCEGLLDRAVFELRSLPDAKSDPFFVNRMLAQFRAESRVKLTSPQKKDKPSAQEYDHDGLTPIQRRCRTSKTKGQGRSLKNGKPYRTKKNKQLARRLSVRDPDTIFRCAVKTELHK